MAKKKQKKKSARKIAVIDFETDPFLYGRKPLPFAAGFFDGETYKQFWGDNCVDILLDYLTTLETPHVIYAHNGGKFDFFYLLEKGALTNPSLIIHGRIVKCGLMGFHELRDSFAILPVPLAKMGKGAKLDIDYAKMERNVREIHRDEILTYLEKDCRSLHQYVSAFIERFGPKLTIGATAISQLGKLHPVSRQDEKHDATFRPFYFGGRVECFEKGEITATAGRALLIYDVNSMYPAAMKNFDHPTGKFYINFGPEMIDEFNHKTGEIARFSGVYFMRFYGTNRGALPVRTEDGLSFNQEIGEFFACSHEIKAACELGLIKVHRIIEGYVPCSYMRFAEYVDKFAAEKIQGKLTDDYALELFSKLLLNSAYGKFATDPTKFKDWFIFDNDADMGEEFEAWKEKNPGYELMNDMGRFELWAAPSTDNMRAYYDVAVAASITSAARSTLLRAIHAAERPIYCDTDSLVCEALDGVKIDDVELGAWKFEGSGDKIYVGGKKLYAMEQHQTDKKTGKPKMKLASKGAKLAYEDIASLCAGETVTWKSDAPNFKMDGRTKFVERKIVMRLSNRN